MENESSCSPLNILKRNWFTVGMIIVVVLAYFFPTVGSNYVMKKIISKIAVAIIFLMAGINLKFAELKKGLPRWTIHATVQTFTFIIFPAVTYLSTKLSKAYLTNNPIYEPIYIGIVILGCVPCSSSSAIVWTKSANGNWIIAAFNSIIANLAGIAITPMLFYMLLSQKPQTEPLTTIRDICIVLVIPMIVGKLISLLIEKKSPNTFEKLHKVKWGDIEKFLLLVIIWISFCDTFMTFKEQKLPLTSILILVGYFSMLYLFMFGVSFLLSKIKFIARDRSEALVLLFTNPSKTLALGIPLILILYKDLPTVGLFQIPLLIYQPLQLTMCGIFVNSLKKWRDEDPELKMKLSIESSKKEDVEVVVPVTSDNEIKDEETISDTEKEETESIEMEELMNQTLSIETNDNEFLDYNENENVTNFRLQNDLQVDEMQNMNDSEMITISIDLNFEINDPEVRDSNTEFIDHGKQIVDQDEESSILGNVEPENNFEILESIDI